MAMLRAALECSRDTSPSLGGSEDGEMLSTIGSEHTPPSNDHNQTMDGTEEALQQQQIKDLLGVEMIDQDKFEADIMNQVDQALKVQETKREIELLQRELKAENKKLEQIERKLHRGQNALNDLCSSSQNRSHYRRSVSLMEEQEVLTNDKAECEQRRNAILKNLKNLGQEVTEDIIEEEEHEKKPNSESLIIPKEEEETEQDRQIRLGEKTAFGTALKSKTGEDEQEHFRHYVADQAAINNHDTKEFKRRKAFSKKKKKKKKRHEMIDEYGAHGTDDSDWESSDDERKRRKKNQALDDGDKEEYIYRLEKWQKEEGDDMLDSKAEELEGGLKVPYKIWEKLYNYQRVCVQWLWELHQQKVGGILGDEMGLGKTIQIIAFLASMSFSQRQVNHGKRFGPVLIVCPTTVMHQWVKEFHKWWPIFRVAVLHESGSHKGSRDRLIRSISSSYGVLVTSYNAILAHKDRLVESGFQYIILDEGHKIRNPDALITLAVKEFTTPHRIILSGSPLQNNLKELWSLFDFIYPAKLGTLPVFMQQFSVPITQGGYSNASRVQVATAYKCATILRDTINPYLLRRMKQDVKDHISLPEKNEQVLFCNLTDEQRRIYRNYLDSGDIKSIMDGSLQIFVGLINLRKICNHPDLYDGGPKHYGRNKPSEFDEGDDFGHWKRSGKMIVVQALLKLWKKQNHRVLLFTQSRQMLSILEKFVTDQGYSYMKLDGSTSIGSRQPLIEKFNSSQDVFVFLLTTKVGGLGVNLTGASRVLIFDPDWNPSTDTQARERAWRIGQDKQVTIYRLLTAGTIEEKIYHRQIFKQFLVNRILKDPKQKRFFKSNDLYELFTLSEGTSDKTETSAIFAGTGSEVQVKKHKKKRKRQRDEHEGGQDVPSSTPVSKCSRVSTDVNRTLQKIYNEEEKPLTEREKLLQKIRAISKKIGEGKEDKEVKQKKKKLSRRFEGHKIPHLVKAKPYQAPLNNDMENEEGNSQKSSEDQDSYVLSKLFKKSGVHTAVQHDMIVDGEGDDYVLIEGEAERVAREAVENLRRSRRECFRAEAGVPTWTGTNGNVARKPKFGKNPSKPTEVSKSDVKHFNGPGISKNALSSSDLLSKIKERNRFLPLENSEANSDNLFTPSTSTSHSTDSSEMELLADIRNFIAFQSNVNGKASTNELVQKFSDRVPPKQSPLFRALLTKICDFEKQTDALKGDGIWKLKPEFC